jgi:D-aspartate ligase
MNFTVLLLGSDANAYYMARSYHELYGKKVDLMNKALLGVTEYSSIINFIQTPPLDTGAIFVQNLNAYADTSEYEKIVLIATNDKYVRLIVENKAELNKKFVFNYPSLELVNTLLVKDAFYQKFAGELELPKTLVYSCTEKPEVVNEFLYPVILKPGNGIAYNKHPFPGMSKVYKIQSYESLLETIKLIENSGYTDNLIIQEFIPGDDSALFDVVFYCGQNKKVQLMTFAQIGLQERTPTGVGNCTVLVNGFDEHGYKEDLIYRMKEFVEKIGFQGFGEFDLKYDTRDGKYKVFEINPRQARSSYYLTACGHNLVQYLIDDLVYTKDKPFVLMKEKMVLSFVPKAVIKKYVTSSALQKEIRSLIKAGKFVRPLHYKGDTNFKRKFYLLLKDVKYILKYRTLTW